MTDVHTKEQRRRNMQAIKSGNTKPEIFIRKLLFKKGFRYRLKNKLEGKPDIVIKKFQTAIFVNGCFWHGHRCHLFKTPRSNTDFWKNKIKKNRKRDKTVKNILLKTGWRILVIWECSLRGKKKIEERLLLSKITSFLKNSKLKHLSV